MLNNIILFSIRNKLIVSLFVLGLLAFGTYQATLLPIDAVPDITDNQVQVITVAPSFSALDIERLVTYPIEQANTNIAGLHEIRSFSRFGLSVVTIVFNDDVDVYWARQQVAERLQLISQQIPTEIGTPTLGPISSGLGEVYQYVLRCTTGHEGAYSLSELRTLQDWIVRRQLLGVQGVAEVSSFGGEQKQYEVAIEPNKLQALGISPLDIMAALQANNANTGGTYIEEGDAVLYIRSQGLLENLEQIGQIAIKRQMGKGTVLLRDVATIGFGHATRFGALAYNTKGEVAGGIVMMLKGANSNQVVNAVKERIAQIEKTLPPNVVLEPFLDRSKLVGRAIHTVEQNLLEGGLIVMVVLILFLGSWQAGLLVASVIPLSLLFAICLMNAFGVSGNLMSLGALDFGLIVDGAVIVVEAVLHQMTKSGQAETLGQEQRNVLVGNTAIRMRNAAIFGELIILVVYLPIFSLRGIEGKMFIPMAQTVAFSLIGAFVLSLTYVPMMSAWVLRPHSKPSLPDRVLAKVELRFKAMLAKALGFPKLLIASIALLFCSSLVVMIGLGGEFIPALEEGDFAIETRMLPGTSLSATVANTQKMSAILLGFDEVEKVVTKTGSGEVPTDPMAMESSDIMVILKEKDTWANASSFDELAEKMGKALSILPGIAISFQYPVQMRFNELMTGARQDVVCKVFGENLDSLANYAHILGKIATTVEGTDGVFVEPIEGLPQVVVQPNRALMAQYGVDVNTLNQVLNTAFAGGKAGVVYEGERSYDLVLRLAASSRRSIADIELLLVPTGNGQQIALRTIADVQVLQAPSQIQREDAKRRVIVGFNIRGRDVQTVVNELQSKVEKQMKFGSGYYITYGGAFENLNAAKARLLVAVPVALALIFILLYFAFGSVRLGLLIYTSIPLSAMGGIFFLALRGMPFSISAGIGFIALFGVSVLNGIVLLTEFVKLRKEGMTDMLQVVLEGTANRLRPVLMTAAVASLGFLPMALSNGAGAQVQRPLATVVIGGLLVSTFLTLFLLPILYWLFQKGKSNLPSLATAVGLGIAFCLPYMAGAQVADPHTITLAAAIDSAAKNNLDMRSQALMMRYQNALQGTARDLPKTTLGLSAGQMNSIYFDNGISVNQAFALPSIYRAQREVLATIAGTAAAGKALKAAELKKAVSMGYVGLLYLQRQIKELQRVDSIYARVANIFAQRLAQGATAAPMAQLAQLQSENITMEIAVLTSELTVAQIQFQVLTNTRLPYSADPSAEIVPISNFTSDFNHVLLLQTQAAQNTATATTKYEQKRLLPEFSIQVNSNTIRGVGGDEKKYGYGTRFATLKYKLCKATLLKFCTLYIRCPIPL